MILMQRKDIMQAIGRVGLKVEPVLGPEITRRLEIMMKMTGLWFCWWGDELVRVGMRADTWDVARLFSLGAAVMACERQIK